MNSLFKRLALSVPQIRFLHFDRARAVAELSVVAAERDRLNREVEALRKEVPWRSVQFAGKELRIFGRRGDPYFDSIDLGDGSTTSYVGPFAAEQERRSV